MNLGFNKTNPNKIRFSIKTSFVKVIPNKSRLINKNQILLGQFLLSPNTVQYPVKLIYVAILIALVFSAGCVQKNDITDDVTDDGGITKQDFSDLFDKFLSDRGIDADAYLGKDIIVWDSSSGKETVKGLLSEEEQEQVENGERTIFITNDIIIIAGKDRSSTERALAENFLPAIWIKEGDPERAVKANLEFAYEIDNPPVTGIKDAPILRNRAKVLYTEGKYDEALSLYDESLSIKKDVVALCGKAQVLGSKGDYDAMVDVLDEADKIDYREIVAIMAYISEEWKESGSDVSCYVSRCPMCGSDVVGILSKTDKNILWSRHKVG